MENILNIIKNIGVGRLIVLFASILLLLGIFAVIILRVSSPPMSLLYGGMEEKEAAGIAARLESLSVPFEIKGGSIYVPQNKVSELRLKVAGEGLVGTSTTGYEIFDKGSTFGTTSLVQNINSRRAMEGELSRTIASLPAVSSARVHLVMPKRKLFAKSQDKPSASVVINLGSRLLDDSQVQSITHLVAAAVPGLTPENVTVVDNRGQLLSNGKKSQANVMNNQAKMRRQIEEGYETSVTRMLERITGPNKVSVKVSADMNFDRLEENSEIFNPEQQVVRSEQRTEEVGSAKSKSGSPAVGVSGNVPGQGVEGSSIGSEENNNKTDETINYEIGKVIRHYIKEGGTVKKLSVAVLVEGKYTGLEGDKAYVPYSEEELSKFTKLVKTSIGFNEERGDKVEIIDMAFTQIESTEIEQPLLTKADYFRIGEYVVMVLGMILIIFMVIKPILKAAFSTKSSPAVGAAMQAAGQAPAQATTPGEATPVMMPDGTVATPGAGTVPVTNPDGSISMIKAEEEPAESLIDIEAVEGKVKESSIKKVIEIIDQYPDESVNVIRGWMTSEGIEGE